MERTLKEGNFSLSRAGEGAMGGRGQGWSDRGDFGPNALFCNFYRTQVSLGSGLWVPVSLCTTPFWNFADVTLADDDTNWILADDTNRAIWVDSCHLGGGQSGLGGHQGGRQGEGTGVAWDIEAGVQVSCDHVGDNIYVVGPLHYVAIL